jgi:hypothetical protein
MNARDPHTSTESTEPVLPAQTDALRHALQQSADTLDGASASRLNRARQAALLAATKPNRRWASAWQWGFGMAATAVLAVVLWPTTPMLPVTQGAAWQADDLSVMVEDADPELIADLEFYAWLEAQEQIDADEDEEDLWEG